MSAEQTPAGTATGPQPASTAPSGAGDAFTDARMAETLAANVLRGRFLWCRGLGWLEWDGRRWRECSDETVAEAVRAWALKRFSAAVRSGHTAGNDPTYKGWHAMLSGHKERAVLGLARGIVEVRADELDACPDLLNAANGVVDLTTGALRGHDPALLLTRLAPVDYDPQAAHPDWSAALEALPADVREWYRVRCGQAATGHTPPDDVLVLEQGGGENGKTTLAAGMAAALGDYHVQVPHRALLASPDAHPTELMTLRGARLAVLEETPEEARLNVVRLKALVGTPKITARLIRRDSVTFDASHSLFVATNYRPVVEQTDHGTWRRLALLRFPYRFRRPGLALESPHDRRGDPTLRERIRTGADGRHATVLAWLVAGAVAWYRAGRVFPPLPERVQADTLAWREESDVILAYVHERLIFDPVAHVMAVELLADFNEWVATRGGRPWGDRTFSARFGDHGEVTARGVERATDRRSERLSRRPPVAYSSALPTPPATYKSWRGLRFRTAADTGGDTSPDQGKREPVTAVTAPPENGLVKREFPGTGSSGDSGNKDHQKIEGYPSKASTPAPDPGWNDEQRALFERLSRTRDGNSEECL